MDRILVAECVDHLRDLGLDVADWYALDVKPRATAAAIHAVPRGAARPPLFVTEYMPEELAALARNLGINFVDRAGNAYLRSKGLHIDIRGRRLPKRYKPISTRASRAFKGMGLRVTFLLLVQPDGVAWTLRDVARAMGASLGTAQGALKDLEEAGYVSYERQLRRLHRTRELFDRWVDGYSLDLRFQLSLAHFDAPDPSWWKRADDGLRTAGAQWGGETAAHRFNPHLRPRQAVIYAPSLPSHFIADNRLVKAADGGTVEIRRRFWHPLDDEGLTVPTPLIYADLVASADPRLLEAAADLRTGDALLQRLDRG